MYCISLKNLEWKTSGLGPPISFRDKKTAPSFLKTNGSTQLRESVHPKTRIERMHGFGSREPNLLDSFRLLGVHQKKT